MQSKSLLEQSLREIAAVTSIDNTLLRGGEGLGGGPAFSTLILQHSFQFGFHKIIYICFFFNLPDDGNNV
jgi:hypothetical protein